MVAVSCGSDSTSTPTSPTPSPSPAPAPTPAPAPAPAPAPSPAPAPATLASLTFASTNIVNNSNTTGTVTLTSAAPAGGAVVTFNTSNEAVARTPASITIAAGSTTGTVTLSASSVPTRTTVRITASYGGQQSTVSVDVTTGLVASFTVTSPTKGTDACQLQTETELNCQLDASRSEGRLVAYNYTLSVGSNRVIQRTTDRVARFDTSGCRFLDQGSTDLDASGNRYFHMTISMRVEDIGGDLSAAATRNVKLYPNRFCDLDF